MFIQDNLNESTITGHLTRDPEYRVMRNNRGAATFIMAYNRVYYAGDEKREKTTFIKVKAYGKWAELIRDKVRKGSAVKVTGSLEQDRYQDKDGNNRSEHYIEADKVRFLYQPGNRNQEEQGELVGAAAGHDQDDEPPF